MTRFGLAAAAALLLGLGGCGADPTDRAIAGGVIGTAGTLVLGAPVVAGAIIGAGIGALTDADEIDLGRPVWK